MGTKITVAFLFTPIQDKQSQLFSERRSNFQLKESDALRLVHAIRNMRLLAAAAAAEQADLDAMRVHQTHLANSKLRGCKKPTKRNVSLQDLKTCFLL